MKGFPSHQSESHRHTFKRRGWLLMITILLLNTLFNHWISLDWPPLDFKFSHNQSKIVEKIQQPSSPENPMHKPIPQILNHSTSVRLKCGNDWWYNTECKSFSHIAVVIKMVWHRFTFDDIASIFNNWMRWFEWIIEPEGEYFQKWKANVYLMFIRLDLHSGFTLISRMLPPFVISVWKI
jgi:hypothetical protein